METTIKTDKATYVIDVTDHWRMAGGALEGRPMYRETYKQYSIFEDGMLVTFVHEEDAVEEAIRYHEWAKAKPAAAARIGSRFD